MEAADRLHGDDTTVPVISARCRGGLPFRGGSRRSRRCRFNGRGDRPARAGERRRHHRFDRRCVGRRAILPVGALFFGLPGNPFAAYVGFRFFVNAALRGMLGLAAERGVLLSADLPGKPGTALIQKARIDVDREGRLVAVILAGQQSHMLRPLLDANALVAIDGTDSDHSVRAFPISPSGGFDL
ncbi:MAG: hypothetical protein Q7J32_10245 [Sphingomonadaceae bacterium]|nr:hypothetical protein [Sphingomonadaceae bacterium]